PVPNIIIFSMTGIGKSSVVNTLAGAQIADTSSDLVGCTFESACYELKIRGKPFKVHNTVRLGEGIKGTVPASQAIESLFHLLHKLEGGINLLVYIMRGPCLVDTARKNYHMFYEIFCDKKVPIVVVVRGLEEEEDRQVWWG
ncbi:hypothetical protein PILCRDRAFT_81792, partial [Piloderma croceum F 1598]